VGTMSQHYLKMHSEVRIQIPRVRLSVQQAESAAQCSDVEDEVRDEEYHLRSGIQWVLHQHRHASNKIATGF